MAKIKKGDQVLIISGKDRGKKSKVTKVFPKGRAVLIENINLRKKHVRPKKSGEKGQILELPAPLDISNIKLICSKCGLPTKVSYKIVNEVKYRICKKCGQET